MYQELSVRIGTKKVNAFLQRGFYLHLPPTKRIHKHNYADVHMVAGGRIVFHIDQDTYVAEDGTLLLIPRDIFHCCVDKDEDAIHTAFQIDYHVDRFSAYQISSSTIFDFFQEIEKTKETNDYTKIAAYISLFCSYFCDKDTVVATSITDYGFLIREFFQTRYSKDVKLRDLADVLNVCERQTERLVIEYTGRTFRDELAFTRITMAKQLLKSNHMSMREVAAYVGYHSYAGFWKAMKKYEELGSWS